MNNKMNEHYNNYCDYTDCQYCFHHICDCKNDIKCQRKKDKEAIMNMMNNNNNNKQHLFVHRHSFKTDRDKIIEHLHETQFSIDGEPQHLWGELKEVKSNKIKINDIRHGEGRNTPEGAYRQLEPFIDKKIYYGITDAMLPYINGKYSGIDIELKIELNITYHENSELIKNNGNKRN